MEAIGRRGSLAWLLVAIFLAPLAWALVTADHRAQLPDLCASPQDAPNAIVAENCQPGAPRTQWDVAGAGDPSIQGFATDISVDQGGTVEFKISTPATAYRLDIYRMGYYRGLGARLIATVQPSVPLPQSQPNCLNDLTTGLVDCGNWAVSASWTVPTTAVSGIYFAKLVREDGPTGSSHVVFVVRDDDGGSDVLFQTSDTTWQAYNRYGGNSLYTGNPAGRAFKVSYNRPFTTRDYAPEDWVFNAEYPMVRWLEANGYEVSYFTGVDADRRGAEILEHQLYLSVGHDEYWSGDQRANVTAARDAGVHLAFLSGNEMFWKTRWEPSIAPGAAAHRTLVSYKETHAGTKIDPLDDVWTGTWRDARSINPEGAHPENGLIGTIFTVNSGTTAVQVPAAEGRLRLWRNTGLETLAAGAVETLGSQTVGYEWDEDLDNGFRPPGTIRLSSRTVNVPERLQDFGSTYGPGVATHSLTLYKAASGALVFGAGTVQWSWGLDSSHDRGSDPADPRMQQATVNLLADMGVQPGSLQPGLTLAAQSTDTAPPLVAITSPADGSTVQTGGLVVTGIAADIGGKVGGVELSTDGGATWHPASGRETWSWPWSPPATGSATLLARAVDDSGNLGPAASITVDVSAGTGPFSVWNDTVVPSVPSENDGQPIEVGVKFFADVNGFVTGLRFYKGAGDTGTHLGHLWDAAGNLLAEVPFAGESASGWQQVSLPTPVALTAGSIYVASYHSSAGFYAVDDGFFTVPRDAPPLHMPASGGLAGPNGVFKYGTPGFPTSTFDASNYWVDLTFAETVGPDTTAPSIVSLSPSDGSSGIAPGTNVIVRFTEALDPTSVTATNFELRGPGGQLVQATVAFATATREAVLDPTANLQNSTLYTARIRGGATGVRDPAGNALAQDRVWSFTTAAPPPPPPDEGPGGPILVIGAAADPFTRYTAEILRAEGLNSFLVRDVSAVDSTTLAGFDVAILGSMPLTQVQVSMFTAWVQAGGNLIAFRPDPLLSGLLGLAPAAGTLADGYLQIDTAGAPGRGLVADTIQFHGTADRYTLAGAVSVAGLFSDALTSTTNPAVTLRGVGSNGGEAAAFTFDLPRSIVFTRQGNPAWNGLERDGVTPIRSDDLFFGGAVRDWVDLSKVAIPQADEQQRLLANLILHMQRDRKPLPRFWYFPRGERAVVVMTGDDHGNSGTAGRLDQYLAASIPGCSVADWECIRASVYVFPNAGLTNAQAATYQAAGFEIGLHVNTNCGDWTPASLEGFYANQFGSWSAKYTSIVPPVTSRTHCIAWSDWATQPKVELAHGIRLDTNYYYWPPNWVNDKPGLFTGSGMPMRFADLDGTMIDVYQAVTQMTDESGQSYPATITALLDRALGPEAWYGAFTANMHVDQTDSAGADAIVAAAKARGVPVVSGKQMLEWLDGRNGSVASGLAWDAAAKRLDFTVSVAAGANGLQGMLPAHFAGGELGTLLRDGAPVSYAVETIKGVDYALFPAGAGSWRAIWDAAPQVNLVDTTAADFGGGVANLTQVTQTADGEVILQPQVGEGFSGTALSAGWESGTWNPGGTATVGSGRLSVDGSWVRTAALFGPGRVLEFTATFNGAPFQNVGFGLTLADQVAPWAMFGTGGTTSSLLARINTGNNATVDTAIPGNFFGAPHSYRIEWRMDRVIFSIDGNVVHTANVAITAQLRPIASDFNVGGPVVLVDSVRMSPYEPTGDFTSRVFDAGSVVAWGGLSWSATTPAGTSVSMSVRTGATATPDGSWSAFAPIGNGGPVGTSSRYLQYRAALASGDSDATPVLEEVRVGVVTGGPNAPPVASNDAYSTARDRALTVTAAAGVLINDVDPEGAPLVAVLETTTDHGTLALASDGSFVYTPAPGFAGRDSFTYRATDGGGASGLATVTITVSGGGFVDTSLADFGGGSLGLGTRLEELGDGAVILAPTVHESFDGTAVPAGWNVAPWGAGGGSTVAGGSVTVDGARLATDASFGPGRSLEAVATFAPATTFQHVGFGQLLANTTGESWAMFSTHNTGTGVYARTNNNGVLVDTLLAGSFQGTPHRYRIDWIADRVIFSIDGNVVHTQLVAIGAQMRPVVSDFNAAGGSVALHAVRMSPYASTGTFASRIFDAGAPVDWSGLTWIAQLPAGSAVSMVARTGDTPTPDGSWSTTPIAASGDPVGTRGRYLQYVATLSTTDDATTPILEQVELAFDDVQLPANVAPLCADGTATTDEGSALEGSVACTDGDGDPLAHRVITQPAHGTVVMTADGSFTYTPATAFVGEDEFTFTASDGAEDAPVATFRITVEPLAAVAVDDSYATDEDVPLQVAAAAGLLSNDTGFGLAVLSVGQPAHGAVIVQADGSFLYTPAPDYFGPDAFTYEMGDGFTTATATVRIAIAAVQDEPVATGDRFQVNEGAQLSVPPAGVLTNDVDVDGDLLAARLLASPLHGTVSLAADGSFVYTPAAGYVGADAFSYQAVEAALANVSRPAGGTSTATVLIDVLPVQHPPVAGADTYAATEDTVLRVAAPGVLGNDRDADGDRLTAALVTNAAHGSVRLLADGSFTYTPVRNYFGPDAFTYRVSDGVRTAQATVSINVAGVNDAPVVTSSTFVGRQDQTLVVPAPGVLSGSSDADGDSLAAQLVAAPTSGTVQLAADGSFVYTPRAKFNGKDSFRIRASDGQAVSNTVEVKINVNKSSGPKK